MELIFTDLLRKDGLEAWLGLTVIRKLPMPPPNLFLEVECE